MGCKELVFLQENRVPSRMRMPELSRLRNTFLCACPGMLGLFVTATVLGKLPPQKAGMRMPTFASLCALCPLWTPSECQLLLQGLELKPFGYAACLEPAHPACCTHLCQGSRHALHVMLGTTPHSSKL